MRPSGDAALIQIVDTALADATSRSGPHLVCHAGCTPCCHGVFAISSLDAARLQEGLAVLHQSEPARALRVKERVFAAAAKLATDYPGDVVSGHLAEDDDAQERFEDFANDEPCPVLDPATGTCDLYAFRPMTCRVFGPPVRSQDGLGICELCFQGATQQAIAEAEMHLPDPALEAALTEPLGAWTTIVTFALATQPQRNMLHSNI